MAYRIIRNRVKCKACGDIIESKYRHDFVWCKCKSIFTDGGIDYIRRGGEPGLMEDMTEVEGGNIPHETITDKDLEIELWV